MHNMTIMDNSKMEFIDLECSKKILHDFQKCSFLLISIFAAKQVTALRRDCSHTAMAQFPAPHTLNMVNMVNTVNMVASGPHSITPTRFFFVEYCLCLKSHCSFMMTSFILS